MPSSELDTVFSLLQSAVSGQPADLPDDTDWKRIFHLLMQNHVVALAYAAIEQLPAEKKPPRAVLIPWLSECTKAESWYRHQLAVQQEIATLMKGHGIETLVLKGTHLAQHYPIPERRQFADLDLYFYNRHREADDLAARHLGVQVSDDAHHHTKYNHNGVTIESHYDFVNRHYPPSNRRFEELLKSMAPSPTFELLFLLRHMAGHFAASRITLRDLADWHFLATAHRDTADWGTVSSAVEESGMQGFVTAINAIAARRLGTDTPLPRSSNRALTDRIENETLYGSLDEHHDENLQRLAWKLKRYRANRWKHRLVYGHDPAWRLLLAGITSHAAKPRSILHKM